MIGGNAARDWAYGSLAVDKPGPRFVHFTDQPARGSRAIDEEFFAQLTAERLAVRRQGYTEWEKPKGKAREGGVCFVYAYAAVCGLQVLCGRYVALGKIKDEPVAESPAVSESPNPSPESASPQPESPKPPPEPPKAPKRRQSWLPKRKSSWL